MVIFAALVKAAVKPGSGVGNRPLVNDLLVWGHESKPAPVPKKKQDRMQVFGPSVKTPCEPLDGGMSQNT